MGFRVLGLGFRGFGDYGVFGLVFRGFGVVGIMGLGFRGFGVLGFMGFGHAHINCWNIPPVPKWFSRACERTGSSMRWGRIGLLGLWNRRRAVVSFENETAIHGAEAPACRHPSNATRCSTWSDYPSTEMSASSLFCNSLRRHPGSMPSSRQGTIKYNLPVANWVLFKGFTQKLP